MAILKSVVDVNNGNTGWTKKDVLDALETVFANLGWHGGTTKNGVVSAAQAPGTYAVGSSESWRRAGGSGGLVGNNPSPYTTKNRYFYVENDGTTAYRILEQIDFSYNQVSSVTDQVYNLRHGLETGDAIHWAPGGTNENFNINGLTLNTIYYAIKVDNNNFKIATTQSNATNGIAIDLTQGPYSNIAAKSNTVYRFRRASSSAYNNYTIQAFLGDRLYFDVVDTSGGKFFLEGNTNNHNSSKILNVSNYPNNVSYREVPNNNVGITDVNTQGFIDWQTGGWPQTEDEPYYITEEFHQEYVDTGDPGTWGRQKYIYASDTHSSMKGEIVLLPRVTNQGSSYYPYWKYTVPASGSRQALKLRVYRYTANVSSTYIYRISDVRIMNMASGWTSADSFTVPGSAIGLTDGNYDLKFGTNVSETASNYGDGVASLAITNIGSGSNFYQKQNNGNFAILKLIHDASKKHGTSYYGFTMSSENNYQMMIHSGNNWSFMNTNATNAGSTGSNNPDYGSFTGITGLDVSINGSTLSTLSSTNYVDWRTINICSSTSSTSYPLSIRVYRAQAPQDSNFAIIQFVQTINGNPIPYGTFTIHKGSSYGSGVWDLENVYMGSLTEYYTGSRSIFMRTGHCGRHYYYGDKPQEEPVSQHSTAREAFYGYLRQPYTNGYTSWMEDCYACNIDTVNNGGASNEYVTYYRNSGFDQRNGSSVNSAANYYKPIKGIPISNRMIPCPYYMPDDFVLLQVATTPGLTNFRPGDTVTVSPSEVYEVVLAGYSNNQNGLDNVENNTTIGMLFLARTT